MTVHQVPSGEDKLVMQGDFPEAPPDLLFAYWVRPDLLRQWWPREAEVEPGIGGTYSMAWPEQGRRLHGSYITFDPGKSLVFTWSWDAETSAEPPMTVALEFTAQQDGTHLTLIQGPYGDTAEDQRERAGHLEGWTYFLQKLSIVADVAEADDPANDTSQ
jgi:uncharacterized protein YndB with AHSA1/START domain